MAIRSSVHFLHAGRVVRDDGWHMKAHLHPFCEMIAVKRGEHRLRIRDTEVRSAPGDVLLYPPRVAHEERAAAGRPFELAFVAFEWPACPGDVPIAAKDARGRIREVMGWLLDELGSYYPLVGELRDRFTGALVAEYERSASAREHGLVERVRAFVRERIREPLTLERLAEEAGLSRYHFVRTYKTQAGHTPMEDVRRLRVEAAQDLLLTTNMPLKQIAPEVGLESEYHLSRLFRRHFGLGARQLRRRVGAEG